MSEAITVISADLDGRQLREQKSKDPRHVRCDGRRDDGQIQEAIEAAGRQQYSIPAPAWRRIFGRGQN